MKTTTLYRYLDRPVSPYPNAATWRQVLGKALDLLLITAICAGISASLVLMAALS